MINPYSNNSFDRITGPAEISKVMRSFMFEPARQNCQFIAAIFDKKNNHIHEGARPISGVIDDRGYTFSLSNSDSGYARTYAQVNLNDIGYIELLRKESA